MTGRRPAPRPSRAGETFARTHHANDDGPSAKKVRFDVRNPSALAPEAPEEDAVLELDEIGKGGQQAKRSAVNLDGYESDSSNEGFDARAKARARAAKKAAGNGTGSAQEDQNDMFADLEENFNDGDADEDLSREGKKSKKDIRFLDEHEIEGQVEGSRAGGHVSADFSLNGKGLGRGKRKAYESSSESDEEVENDRELDEEVGAGGKKVHAPKLSAFHMKEELEEGRFDAQGNFVRKAADPDAVHDTWLEGISKKDRRRAREAEQKREEERRQRTLAEDELLTADILKTLIPRLERGETVLEALARLGTGNKVKPKKPPKWKSRKNPPADVDMPDVDVAAADDSAETHRRQAVEDITGAADLLLTRGQTDIYDDTREALQRQYRRETGHDWIDAVVPDESAPSPPALPSDQPDDWNNNHDHLNHDHPSSSSSSNSSQWLYRWTDLRDDGEIHGPYDARNMLEWQRAGFFQEGVEFRKANGGGGARDWTRLVDFT